MGLLWIPVLLATWLSGATANYKDNFNCKDTDCYMAVNVTLNQEDAASCCALSGGHLAAVATDNDGKRLKDLMRRQKWSIEAWIGAELEVQLWHWHDGKQFLFRQGCYTVTVEETPHLTGNITLSDCVDICYQNNYKLASMAFSAQDGKESFSCYCNQLSDLSLERNWRLVKSPRLEEKCHIKCLDDVYDACGGDEPNKRYLYVVNGTKQGYWGGDALFCQRRPPPPHPDGGSFGGGPLPHEGGGGGPPPYPEGRGDQGRDPRGGPLPRPIGGSKPGGPWKGQKNSEFQPPPLGKPAPKVCAAITENGPHICYVPQSCSDPLLPQLCQYRPPRNRTCRYPHQYLEKSNLCIFSVSPAGNPQNTHATKICRQIRPNAIPLELTSPEIEEDIRHVGFPPRHQFFWTGLEKWKVKWPADSKHDPIYTDWANGEPQSDISKLCIALSGEKYEWANRNCHTPLKFICQIPKSSASALNNLSTGNPCAADPVIRASRDARRIPVIPLGAGLSACAVVAAVALGIGLSMRRRKQSNKKEDSLKEDLSENKAYGTITGTENLREEVYDELNEGSMTNYASLSEIGKFDDPPNDERYRRLTTSSDHSSGSTNELTKHELTPAQEDCAPGPELPPRDMRYTRLSRAEDAKNDNKEGDDDVFVPQEGDTDNAEPPRVYDNRPNDDNQPSTTDSEIKKDTEDPSNNYLKLVG